MTTLRSLPTSLLLPCVMVVALHAQPAIEGPYLGVVVDRDGTATQLTGIPGTARAIRIGPSRAYGSAVTASHRRFVVAVSNHTLLLPAPLPAIPVTRDSGDLAVSPLAKYIAWRESASDTVDLYRLPDLVHRAIAVTSCGFDASEAISVAISDAGTLLLAGDDRVVALGPDPAARAFVPVALRLVRFTPNGDLAFAYAPTLRAVVAVHTGTMGLDTLFSDADGLNTPNELAISDATTLWVSQSAGAHLLRFDLPTRTLTPYTLDSSGQLRSIGAPGLYLWSPSALLDLRAGAPTLSLLAVDDTH